MPYNLQTATTETSSAFTTLSQLVSEITSGRAMEMWPGRARKLVISILRQFPELLSLRASQCFHYKPHF